MLSKKKELLQKEIPQAMVMKERNEGAQHTSAFEVSMMRSENSQQKYA